MRVTCYAYLTSFILKVLAIGDEYKLQCFSFSTSFCFLLPEVLKLLFPARSGTTTFCTLSLSREKTTYILTMRGDMKLSIS